MTRWLLLAGLYGLDLPLCADEMSLNGAASPKPIVTTRLYMPRHPMIPGRCGELEGYFALDSGSPANAPTMLSLQKKFQQLRDLADGERKVRADIHIEDASFSLDFGTGERLVQAVEKEYPGIPVLGILGNPFLSRYIVRLDYLSQTFSLFGSDTLPLPQGDERGPEHVLVDFTTTSQGHIMIDLAMGEGDPLKGKMIFDLGTPRLEFQSALSQQHGFPKNRIPTMRIGAMTWTDVPVLHNRDKLLKTPFFKSAGIMGLLSNEQFTNTVVTIYYKEKKLSIRRDPSRTPGPAPEEFGLDLAPDGVIARVHDGSRAAACGFKVADILRALDGQLVRNRMEIASALRLHDGKAPCVFRVARAGNEISLTDPGERGK